MHPCTNQSDTLPTKPALDSNKHTHTQELHRVQRDTVLRQAAREHIRRATVEDATVDGILSMRMDELRARFDDDSNAMR